MVSTISPRRNADSSAPTIKSSIATVRGPARLRSVSFAPSAAIANGTIGDIARNAAHGTAGDIRNASVLDIGVRDARSENQFVAATLDLLEFGKPGDVDDQLR